MQINTPRALHFSKRKGGAFIKGRFSAKELQEIIGKLKGALDNFSLIPRFVLKSWDFYTIRSVYTYVVTIF